MSSLAEIAMESPLGPVLIRGTEKGITTVDFFEAKLANQSAIPACLKEGVRQLTAYFHGDLQAFDLTLDWEGTPFQQEVWKKLLDIPFGKTAAYLDIAKKIGNPKAVRAVGSANGQNKIAIIVPCHRVIGSNGNLTGYAGGLSKKRWLLAFERSQIQPTLF